MKEKGPDPINLKFLDGMLPSFAKGVVEGKVFGAGRAVAPTQRPRAHCPICLDRWDWVPITDEFQPRSEFCGDCKALLDEGFIAFVCGGEYSFAKSPKLADMAGKMVHIKPETFEAIRTKFQVRQRAQSAEGA